jgi:hypothetical protein
VSVKRFEPLWIYPAEYTMNRCGVCSAGVQTGLFVLLLLPRRKTAGRTPALQKPAMRRAGLLTQSLESFGAIRSVRTEFPNR